MNVKDADVDHQRNPEEGETAGHAMKENLFLGQFQIAQHFLPKVMTDESQSQKIRINSDVFDTVQNKDAY